MLFGIPVYADSNTYIIDQSDVLGEYISTLNEKAETISEEAGLRITCMITNTTEGMGTPAVSEQVYKGLFADDPGFMLIYSIDDQEWFIYSSGMESAPLTEEQENELWNEFAIQDYYVDCVDAYLDAAAAICSVDSQGVAEPAATDSQGDDQTAGADISETTEASGSNTQEAGGFFPVGNLCFFKRCLIDICGSRIHHILSACLQKPSHFQRQSQIVILFLSALIDRTRILPSVSAVHYNLICHTFPPVFLFFFLLYAYLHGNVVL